MKHLVIGLGQIGSAIAEILKCDGEDVFKNIHASEKKYDVIHIAFPFSDTFVEDVKKYQDKYEPEFTVIHSTVPMGTSRLVGAIHSPCRGIHPNLVEGIRTFTKFFGGIRASEAALMFENIGIKTYTTDKPEDTEALKLWDTTIYGLNIVLEKEIHRYCEENDLDFDVVYTLANHTYNTGYAELGHPEYQKYILKHHDGKIGGHCVIPNLPLLEGHIAEFINDYNERL